MNKISEPNIVALALHVLGFVMLLILKRDRLKLDCGRKSMPNFALYDPQI